MTSKSTVLKQFDETLEAVRHDCVATQLLEILFESAERYFTSVTSMECRSRLLPDQDDPALTQQLQLHKVRRQHARSNLLKNCHIANQYLIKEFRKGLKVAGVKPTGKTVASHYDTEKLDVWVRELLFGVFCQRER